MQLQAETILKALHGGVFKDTLYQSFKEAFVQNSIITSQYCDFDKKEM